MSQIVSLIAATLVAIVGYLFFEPLQQHVGPIVRSLVQSRPTPVPVGKNFDAAACTLAAGPHLTDVMPVQGFHVLCLTKTKHDTYVYRAWIVHNCPTGIFLYT
jgi:hypothetical protein